MQDETRIDETRIGEIPAAGTEPDAAPRPRTPAAERALAEAAERRRVIDAHAAAIAAAPERLGRGGLEPVRYDDWEVKGLAVDF